MLKIILVYRKVLSKINIIMGVKMKYKNNFCNCFPKQIRIDRARIVFQSYQN